LDYALRKNGWLTEYRSRPDTWCFAVEQAGQLVAFSILSKTGETEAEFRIALRADKTGKGLGGAITTMTLTRGFTDIGLSRIHLIVRKNNSAAIRLYSRLGFSEQGECVKNINGKQTDFLMMELLKKSYSWLTELER
jgi:RimJ/RimL family protein N-acetyltransferase